MNCPVCDGDHGGKWTWQVSEEQEVAEDGEVSVAAAQAPAPLPAIAQPAG